MVIRNAMILAAGILGLGVMTAWAGDHVDGAAGAGSGSASGSGSSSSDIVYPYPYFDHFHNRAIAFGSVILANEGYDTAEWKAVNAYNFCSSMPMPIPPTPIPDPNDGGIGSGAGSDSGSGSGSGSGGGSGSEPGDTDDMTCWEVLVTTGYDFKVCDDGRAFILRRGISLWFENRNSTTTWEWAEGSPCDWSDEREAAIPGNTDARRPLDLKRITKTRR